MRARGVGAFALTFFVSLGRIAAADEALVEMSGGCASLCNTERSSVSMERATIQIELHPNTYTVDASFVFKNDGDTTTELVGFPNTGLGYFDSFTGLRPLKGFKTWVEGKRVSVKEVGGFVKVFSEDRDGQKRGELLARDDGAMRKIKADLAAGRLGKYRLWQERRWYVKEVEFPAHGTVRTRVRYSATYDRTFPRVAQYLYGTGGAWQGAIGRLEFTVIEAAGAELLDLPGFSASGMDSSTCRTPMIERLDERRVRFTLENIEPEPEESLMLGVADEWFADWYSEEIEGKKELEEPVLRMLTQEQLVVFKNWILAKAGKPFNEAYWRVHFSQQDWYKPNPQFSFELLNATQRRNLDRLDGETARRNQTDSS